MESLADEEFELLPDKNVPGNAKIGHHAGSEGKEEKEAADLLSSNNLEDELERDRLGDAVGTLSVFNRIEGESETEGGCSKLMRGILIGFSCLLACIPLFWFCYLRVVSMISVSGYEFEN